MNSNQNMMTKGRWLLILLAVLVAVVVGVMVGMQLDGTTSEPEPEPEPSAAMPDILDGWAGVTSDDPDFRLPVRVEITVPASERYTPEHTVMPLINFTGIYSTGVTGDLAFVDRELNVIPSPVGDVLNYLPVYDRFTGEPACIALRGGEEHGYKFAFMHPNGAMATGFLYQDYSQGDTANFICVDGYVGVASYTADYDLLGCGVLDLRTGEMTVPAIYDDVQLFRGAILASKDGYCSLLDYAGAVLYDFGQAPDNDVSVYANVRYTDAFDCLDFCGTGYNIRVDEHNGGISVYKGEYAEKYATLYPDRLIITTDTGPDWGDPRIFKIFDKSGKLLCEKSGFQLINDDNGNMIIAEYDNAAEAYLPVATVVTSAGDVLECPLPEDELWKMVYMRYEGGALVIPEDTDEVYEYGHVRSSFSGEWLVDDDGNPITQPGQYAVISERGPFVIVSNYKDGEWGETVIEAVLALDGRVLIEKPLGAVYEFAFPDSLVVYTDAATCLMLYTDGTTKPISGAPPVERLYIGG